jgi:hypothetical protein
MKMVKSLLLGSAAGVVAIAGAQAADLPVKAKPVQYVKICSLYGVGFYYIPGTDMCLKIGGWVRAEYAWGDSGSQTTGPYFTNANNRLTNDDTWRARGYITADARNQTPYGTVRSYIAVGVNSNAVGVAADIAPNVNRAFIQWAGWTFGLSQSFYDFYSVPATAYWGVYPASDTGDPGWLVIAYTAQFGNGLSATLSGEMRRMTQIVNQTGNTVAAAGGAAIPASPGTLINGGAGPGAYGGFQSPDIVGNIRLEQAWGSAQIMGALHQVNGQYYTEAVPFLNQAAGHPGDDWGFVIGGGIKLLVPQLGKGDYLQAQVSYTEGALRYVFQTPNFNWANTQGDQAGWGYIMDAIYGGTIAGGTNTGLELTSAWGVNAAYEHFWNAQWKTSLYGGYAEVSYGTLANAMICSAISTAANPQGAGVGSNSVAFPGCDQDWSTWWVGTRTQWNVTKDFYMGLDVLYQNLQSASSATGFAPFTAVYYPGAFIDGPQGVSDMENWAFRFRVHKDFYP